MPKFLREASPRAVLLVCWRAVYSLVRECCRRQFCTPLPLRGELYNLQLTTTATYPFTQLKREGDKRPHLC